MPKKTPKKTPIRTTEADNLAKVSNWQKGKMKKAGIDKNAQLKDQNPVEYIKKILSMNIPDQDKQLALNLARNVHYKLNHTYKHWSYNPIYFNNDPSTPEENPSKQAEIEAMYTEMPYLSEYAAELLWSIDKRTAEKLRQFIDEAAKKYNYPDYKTDARQRGLAVREAAQDLFEMILMNRDVYPEEWYNTYYCVEMVLNNALNPEIAPPGQRLP